MAAGDQNDMLARLRAVLPEGWFPDDAPVLDAVLTGIAYSLAWAFSLIAYAANQTRLLTATDVFLDILAVDFFGGRIFRKGGESDASFRARIRRELLRPKATRSALALALTDLTGQVPLIFEPGNSSDTGGYDLGGCGYDAAGGYGAPLEHGETVCCAGLTPEGRWRRQYPVHYRRLEEGFGRWSWIEYDWIRPGADDRRAESRRVQQETIRCVGKLRREERAAFLDRVVVPSCEEAAARGQSLALIRPRNTRFWWKLKPARQLAQEKGAYERAASQLSFLDDELAALEPCPYEFKFTYETEDGRSHRATCDDWETSAAFYRRRERWESRPR